MKFVSQFSRCTHSINIELGKYECRWCDVFWVQFPFNIRQCEQLERTAKVGFGQGGIQANVIDILSHLHALAEQELSNNSCPYSRMKVFSLTLFCHSSLSSGLNSSNNATLFNLFSCMAL